MRFPGIAYSFQRPTDVNTPTALILSRHFQISTSSSLLEFLFSDLAKDRVLVLTNVSVIANPGGAQIVLELAIQAFSQGVENFNIDRREPAADPGINKVLNWQGEIYIQGGGPGTNTLRIFTFYDAPILANSMTVGVHGIIIPRGNLGGF